MERGIGRFPLRNDRRARLAISEAFGTSHDGVVEDVQLIIYEQYFSLCSSKMM